MVKQSASETIVISGTGCALGDNLYNNINFRSPAFIKYLSSRAGDGGLKPGNLVFAEELSQFANIPYKDILSEITGNRPPDAFNIGGPSIVSLIHASQLLSEIDFSVRFFGVRGSDEPGTKIMKRLKELNLDIDHYLIHSGLKTPITDVLSDPEYNEKQGERTFVNTIGAAAEYEPDQLDPSFFESDIVCFGGTALVPKIHDNLSTLLKKAKERNCITIVNTVYDFQSEQRNPSSPWPLVNSPGDYSYIDILILDREEAIKISGKSSVMEAAGFFAETQVSSFFITNGSDDILVYSKGTLFNRMGITSFPVSLKVKKELKNPVNRNSDTTGCGDNFVGGIIVSVAEQYSRVQQGKMNIKAALGMGVASGGFACNYLGGVYEEAQSFEKRKKVDEIFEDYMLQLKD